MVGPQLSAVPWFDSGGWARMSDTDTAERYWGGWTERGQLLHFAVGSTGQCARSACGLVLTGGASSLPPDILSGTATCKRCDAASRATSHDTAPELGPTPQTVSSDRAGSCGHPLDEWETHLEHSPDCPRELCLEDRCDCPEVCPDCCRACGYDAAERMGS